MFMRNMLVRRQAQFSRGLGLFGNQSQAVRIFSSEDKKEFDKEDLHAKTDSDGEEERNKRTERRRQMNLKNYKKPDFLRDDYDHLAKEKNKSDF